MKSPRAGSLRAPLALARPPQWLRVWCWLLALSACLLPIAAPAPAQAQSTLPQNQNVQSANTTTSNSRGVSSNTQWAANLLFGAGMQGRSGVTVLKPKVSVRTPRIFLALGVPLWFRVRPGPADGNTTNERLWLNSWANPDTYAAILNRLQLVSSDGVVAIDAGPVVDFTVGSGMLIDRYYGSLNPARPRTGASISAQAYGTRGALSVDSLAQPTLVAFNLQTHKRNKLSAQLEAALDPTAPTTWRPGLVETTPVLGLAGTGRLELIRDDRVGTDLFAGVAGTIGRGLSVHSGTQFELWLPAWRWPLSLACDLDVFVSTGEHTPGTFDVAYSIERKSTPQGAPKAALQGQSDWGVRTHTSLEWGLVTAGLRTTSFMSRKLSHSQLYATVAIDRFRMTTMFLGRHLLHISDLFASGQQNYLSVQATAQLPLGLAAHVLAHHGWQQSSTERRIQTTWDWGLALSYSLGTHSS